MKEVNNPRELTGQAWDTKDEPGGQHDCIVTLNIEGKGPLHEYTLPTMPVLFPQQMTNFMMGAHESEHCLYRAELSPNETSDAKYSSSVRELSADLSAALYYARETGSFEHGYIKARDDANPSLAQQMMVKEMAIREKFVDYKSGMQWPWKSLGSDTESYSRDILLSLRRNHLAFQHLGNEAEQSRAAFAYGKFVERRGIEDVNDNLALTRVLQPKEKDPKLDRVLDVIMGL
ncbi:hypothetical protein [Pseudomonas amygdali]|uniref:Insecticidal toxin protein n=2 Tax=Pseudomonas amygdali pv. lachrymans TaxID=53707 RepID=A0ABR5KRJ9_PSEAV|nr:hypothetical protein [Pseudomonas amygdali]KPC17275.1 Uncharacterized protein AC499_0477 [Pseudomonas amygdali pv. lachrymans]RMT05697.1 hypothetical protein ALP54_03739 [Pseudomonas amygdali pv. lachrymans]